MPVATVADLARATYEPKDAHIVVVSPLLQEQGKWHLYVASGRTHKHRFDLDDLVLGDVTDDVSPAWLEAFPTITLLNYPGSLTYSKAKAARRQVLQAFKKRGLRVLQAEDELDQLRLIELYWPGAQAAAFRASVEAARATAFRRARQ